MKISIITSTYNNEKELGKLFDSLMAQKEYVYEWIICDDGSSDSTWNVARELAMITPFNTEGMQQMKKGARYATNLNNGFRKATGDIVFVVNGDSYLDSNTLKEIKATFITGSAGSGMRLNLNKDGSFHGYDWRVPDGNSDVLLVSNDPRCYTALTGNGMIIDRKVFEKVGYWDEAYTGYGRDDWDFFLRLQRASIPLYQYNNVRLFVEHEEAKPDSKANIERFEMKLRGEL